ncbi:MAG: GTP 3',8-cyclase MoaA [Gammaproteobacteria bacterium]
MLADKHGRQFPYLRLSLTDVCNFRCNYCLPDGYRCENKADELSLDELERLGRAFTALGTRKIRLTGGEPTVRRDFNEIVERIGALPGLSTLALTTNGYRLRENALRWRAAGVNAINISIDSLDAQRFHQITGHDRHAEVVAGVDACLDAGYRSVKVNTVLMRGINDGELDSFIDFVRGRPVALRFIELMETGDRRSFFREHHVSSVTIRESLEQRGWAPCVRRPDAGPAIEFAHPDHAGRIGLIAPYSKDFCASCNRLRVSSRGELYLCLFGDGSGLSLRELLQHDEQLDELADRIRGLLAGKQAGHRLHEGVVGNTRHLAQIGG